MKDKYLLAYVDMAERFAQTSEAQRLKVAALIIKNNSVISLGINGSYPGWPTNICEDKQGQTAWYVRHAESSALDKLVRSSESSEGSIMVITHAPCKMCGLRIKDAGVSAVYYRNTYRDLSGVEYLKQNGVLVKQI